jgi:endo-1,4-beta-xylanase
MRLIIGLLAVSASCVLSAQSIRSLADERGIRFGTAVAPLHLNETGYATVLAREFNQVEPENDMKFGPIHPGPATYNFAAADKIVAFAEAHRMAVRGHTLVWHNQVPKWLTTGTFTPEQLSSILQDHIKTVVGRYAGKVYAWDVVNEAFENDGSMRKTLWSSAPGIGTEGAGYIEQALRWAHAADPQALLFYNDFGAETVNPKSNAIYKMAQDFKARGVPLDGIGMQMHISTKPQPLAGYEANMKRITGLGLQVQITELDVKLPVDVSGVATPELIDAQAKTYHDIVAVCLKNPRCTAIQTWGFTDRYSWIPHTSKGFGAALEFDPDYQPKPACQSILDALKSPR